MCFILLSFFFFFFNDPAPTEIYTLSLHDALPISPQLLAARVELVSGEHQRHCGLPSTIGAVLASADRKSTRLNSSHGYISYAVFCLKKKKKNKKISISKYISLTNHSMNQTI